MKKIFLTLFLLITYPLLTNHCLYAGWPINRTPKIEGRVSDATTGEPLENVVISCRWMGRKGVMVDSVGKVFDTEVYITDKEGNYKIPHKNIFQFFTWSYHLIGIGSEFDYIGISFLHPLYATKEYSIAKIKFDRYNYESGLARAETKKDEKERETVEKYWKNRGKYSIRAEELRNIDLDILVEKYGTIHYEVKLAKSVNFNPEYFIAARKSGTDLNYLRNLVKEFEEAIGQKQREKILRIISMSDKDFSRKCVFYHGHWEIWNDK